MAKWHLLLIDSKMKGKITYLILLIIIVIASILRLWRIGDVPISPDWDEVALGYNAYSIIETGRDEYGEFLPIILRSFDDYKPALYAYLAIPSISVLGLNVTAVRFPSALFGILTVLLVFFLVKELFKKDNVALLTSFLLAISPWHIQFSRIAFESNVGLAFNVFAALFFLWGLRKPWLLILSSLFASVNLYAYQSEKVFTPLLLTALIILFRKELFLLPKKYIVIAAMLGFFVSMPIAHYTLTNREALSRAKDVSILANTTPFLQENVQRLIRDRERHDYLGLILDNRRVTYLKTITASYLSHFDLNWLFIKGDIARHHAPNMGLLYLWELPFLMIGIYMLVFGTFDKRAKLVIFLWFLIAPIPASITSGVPHAVRTLNFLPTFQIFTAIGALTVFQSISNINYEITKIHIKYLISALYFLFFIFNFLYFLNQYFVQQNYFHSQYWQYGYEEAVSAIRGVENEYNKIIVSNQPPLDQSYIFFLFYLKYPPDIYQKEVRFASGKLAEIHRFGKFEFRPIDWNTESKDKKILYMGTRDDFPINVDLVKAVYFFNSRESKEPIESVKQEAITIVRRRE